MLPFSFTILGELASKSNNRKLVIFGHKPAFIKSTKAQAWMTGAILQLRVIHPRPRFEIPVKLTARVYYRTRRPDLDIELLKDTLQAAGILKNDRLVEWVDALKLIDKANPRVSFTVEEIM